MKKDRRTFLQITGTLTAGSLLLPHFSCNNTNSEANTEDSKETEASEQEIPPSGIDQFGLQLYTLRDIIQEDPKTILEKVASFGYQQIESYDHKELGIFMGMDNKEYKNYLDDLGLKTVSTHCDINKDFETKVAQAAEIGIEYVICPHVGAQDSMDAWKKITDQFNSCGEICKKNGVRFAYHNHAYSFEDFSGIIPHDYIMANTDPELVDFEMDIYWVVTSGTDPIEYLKKYPNRFRLSHVKDRMKDVPATEQKASCDLGTGIIDYPKILKVAKEQGMKYFIVEQERYDGSSPMQSAQVGAEYLKQLVFK